MRPRHPPGDTVLQRLPQMVIFDALVREQGISAAARRLGVSKSHISKAARPAGNRARRPAGTAHYPPFGLTELGQEYARHCRALVAVALEAEHGGGAVAR